MEVDTNRLRDKVANLSELLGTTMGVVERLRQITVAPSAFGNIGLNVHAISRQVQDKAAANIDDVLAVLRALGGRSADFAENVDRVARQHDERLRALRRNVRRPGGG